MQTNGRSRRFSRPGSRLNALKGFRANEEASAKGDFIGMDVHLNSYIINLTAGARLSNERRAGLGRVPRVEASFEAIRVVMFPLALGPQFALSREDAADLVEQIGRQLDVLLVKENFLAAQIRMNSPTSGQFHKNLVGIGRPQGVAVNDSNCDWHTIWDGKGSNLPAPSDRGRIHKKLFTPEGRNDEKAPDDGLL